MGAEEMNSSHVATGTITALLAHRAGLPLTPALTASRPAYGLRLCWASLRRCLRWGRVLQIDDRTRRTGRVRGVDHAGERRP